MSRIGKLPIKLPENVNVQYDHSRVTVKGPRGTLEKTIRFHGKIMKEENELKLLNEQSDKNSMALHGLARSLIHNMVIGVTRGFTKTLKIVGVGYKAQIQGKVLSINLGFSHTVQFPVPEGIKIDVPDPNTIVVEGIDKELVGQVASDIRRYRQPEPYKGKGIMYSDETIKRKAGKAGVK
jgi:large subunit ribosomal protein L6